ncbi:MAG TPA: tetratricopeptide repeat protein [Steroidobacter sp.]|nr:tetratricopeptide repeat protein [Steroidobacter sp.]
MPISKSQNARVPLACRLAPPWLISLMLVLAAGACSRDPQALKAKHQGRGDEYAAQKKFAEAAIEYRNAVQAVPQDGEVRLKLAEALWQAGELSKGAAEYVRAADLLETREDVQVKAGNLLLAGGNFDDAKVRAEKALKLKPDGVEAHILLANSLAGLKDIEAAIAEIEEAIRLEPGRSGTYSDLGTFQTARGRHDEAEKAFLKAVSLDRKSSHAHLALANFYWVRQRWTEAEKSLKDAIDADSENLLAYRALASLAVAQKRPEEAESYLKKVADLSKTPEATLALADFYITRNDFSKARTLIEPLAKEGRAMATANVRLAALDHTSGNRDEAYARIEKVLAADPNNMPALLAKTSMLLTDNRANDAEQSAKQAISADPNSATAYFALGRAAERRNELAAAEQAYKDALRVNPHATGAQVALAQLQLRAGRAPDAVNLAESALKTNPGSPEARLTLVRGLIARGDLARAETELAQLAKQYPNASAVHVQRGLLLGRKRDLAGARREFDEALKLAPASTDALNGLIALDFAERRPDAAKTRIAERVRDDNASVDLLMLGGRTYMTAGDSAEAEKLYRRVLAKDASYLPAYSALAQLYLKEQRLNEALAEFEALAQRDKKPVAALTASGMILETQGKKGEARQRYERALATDPSAAVAANNLAWMQAESGENLDVALQLAQTAYSKLPENADVSDTLGFVYYKKGLYPQAVKLLKASVEKEPAQPLFHYHLGLALSKSGDTDGAVKHLTKALELPNFTEAADARAVLATLR